MAKHKLTNAQKDEIRRLTQLANRRIKSAFKEYEKEGLTLAPKTVTGGIQTREQWNTKNYALSRSVKFDNEKEYRKHLKFLRSFVTERPNMTEFTQAQREKTKLGVETSLGIDIPSTLAEVISRLNAPQLSKFWKKFSEVSAKMGLKYASEKALDDTIVEFFTEDAQGLASGLASSLETRTFI